MSLYTFYYLSAICFQRKLEMTLCLQAHRSAAARSGLLCKMETNEYVKQSRKLLGYTFFYELQQPYS